MAGRGEGLVLQCPKCGQANRVPFGRVGQRAKCGRCEADVRDPGKPVAVDGAELEGLIQQSPLPVLVDFWAPWCGPCRMVAPQLEQVAQRMAGEVVVAKLNTDECPEAGARYRVQSIPLFVVFARGREVLREAGARPAAQIERLVRAGVGRAA
jgi:thioredoxin 2